VKFLAINGDLVKGGDYANIYSFGGDLVNYLYSNRPKGSSSITYENSVSLKISVRGGDIE
jgi:hypothetical protein